jgi:hypothetical protein
MEFQELMQSYFRGERMEALFYIMPAGILFFALAATALGSDRGGFGWGLAVPLVVFGLALVGVGTGIALRTPSQVEALDRAFQEDSAAMVREELPRMQKVNSNWPKLIATWAALVVIGLGLRFVVRADWAHGVGPALILAGAVGFLIDGFAERRARPYTAALEAIAAQHTSKSPP